MSSSKAYGIDPPPRPAGDGGGVRWAFPEDRPIELGVDQHWPCGRCCAMVAAAAVHRCVPARPASPPAGAPRWPESGTHSAAPPPAGAEADARVERTTLACTCGRPAAACTAEASRPPAGAEAGEALDGIGARLIVAERRRQVEREGWSPEHDGQHGHAAELMKAGQAYMRNDSSLWPWPDGWKPKRQFRNLVRAGALFQAALDTGDLTALAGNATGFRNVCARMIDELVAEVVDAVLPIAAAPLLAAKAEAEAERDKLREAIARVEALGYVLLGEGMTQAAMTAGGMVFGALAGGDNEKLDEYARRVLDEDEP